MIQEIAIKTKEKNNLKSSNEKKEIGQIFEKKLPISPAVRITTNPSLNPTPVRVTTPTIIPTQTAAAPTAKVFLAPAAKQNHRSFILSRLFGLIKPITIW